MAGEPIREIPQKPVKPVKPEVVGREPHYPGHGVSKGPDFAPIRTPKQEEDFLRQRQHDWDSEDREEMIDDRAERLHTLMVQEGKITEPDASQRSNPEYKNIDYNRIWGYVESGRIPNGYQDDKQFASDLTEIVKRDAAGEWEEEYTLGQPIPKKNPQR